MAVRGILPPTNRIPKVRVLAVIYGAIGRKVTPGAVAAMSIGRKLQWSKAYGNFTYGQKAPITGANPAVQVDTKYDLASLTKVTTTTSAIATFYQVSGREKSARSALHLSILAQRGELALETLISDPKLLGPPYATNGKDTITVENCLLHNAGYPPDPDPMYWSAAFACPATAHTPVTEVFTCVDQAYTGLMKQTLINPVGSKYLHTLEEVKYAPSTLRKYLNLLEENGLVYQPYNSSGRVPTVE
jgi:CubicO group peptidase (beta-lactamase class C family)